MELAHRSLIPLLFATLVATAPAALAQMPSPTPAQESPQTVKTLDPALRSLGVRMLYPKTVIEENRVYPLLVKSPAELIPLGVDDVGPGDRVMARLLPGNQLILYTSFGDTTAPIQLDANGNIVSAQTVRQTELNQHSSAATRHERRSLSYGQGGNQGPPADFGRASSILNR
jgi:hypothetical protein